MALWSANGPIFLCSTHPHESHAQPSPRAATGPLPLGLAWKLKGVTIKKTAVKAGKKAMLSRKQLQGFRCMACYRSLNKLGRAPGKHISTNALINHVDQLPAFAFSALFFRRGGVRVIRSTSANSLVQAFSSKLRPGECSTSTSPTRSPRPRPEQPPDHCPTVTRLPAFAFLHFRGGVRCHPQRLAWSQPDRRAPAVKETQ